MIDIAFRFPQVFWALIFLPLLIFLAGRAFLLGSRVLRVMGAKPAGIRRFLSAAGLLLALVCFTIAIAEPYVVESLKKPVWKGEAVDFVVDLSLSQNAEDITPRRIDAVKTALLKAADILSQNGLTTLCLGFFTTSFNRLIECSPDIANFKAIVERLEPAWAGGVGGTSLLAALPDDYEMIRKEVIPKSSKLTLFIITDGGKEMWKDANTSAMTVLEPDWNEAELKNKIMQFVKDGVRVVPVGIGGEKPVPVYAKNIAGGRAALKTSTGETFYTVLDKEILKKIAAWSGDPNRYFIIRDGVSFSKWVEKQVASSREVDYYVTEFQEKDLWKYPLALGIIVGALTFLL